MGRFFLPILFLFFSINSFGATAPERGAFDGVWQTNYGPMRLVHEGDKVHGIYSFTGDSTVNGTVKNNRVEFQFKEPQVGGDAWFELADDKKSFKGKWHTSGSEEWKDWEGKLVDASPNVQWLYVLEYPWQKALSEPEFSFGEMLKSFFARSSHIKVRHRFFHDSASLEKLLRDAAYLAEPSIVMIASHGEKNGIVASDLIPPSVVSNGLKYASTMKLLHFGACDILGGSFGKKVQKELGKTRHVPISGYKTPVDWGLSAISEFLYLELVMNYDLEPKEAAKLLPRMIPQIKGRNVASLPMGSADFALLP
jgi:hypothetical protein